MHADARLTGRLIRIGVAAGLAGVVMYLATSLLPLPTFLGRPFWVLTGPLMTIAFVGLFPFVAAHGVTASAVLGTVLGAIAGALRCVFAVVQSSNRYYIRRYAAEESGESAGELWSRIFDGVFTVQSGINYAYDLFLDLAVVFLAVALWRHPGPGRAFAVSGVAVAALHFTLKLVTFPEPPAAAGLVDVGPAVALWFLALLVWVLFRTLRTEEV